MNAATPIPQIEFAGVDKRYSNGRLVLSGLNISVAKGEFVSFLGPSGCGKTTILKLIAGLTPPSDGTVRVDGMTPKDARETVSYIFQDATLLPWRNVLQNVGLGLELERVGKDRRAKKTAELLDLVGLGHVAKAYPRELSGGMKMRASIARALITRPAVLLMDEPFAALDEITRTRLNDDLVALKCSLGATVVFVTHSVFESVYLSTRIVIFAPRPGRAVAEISVDAPLPRSAEFRMSPGYAEKCRETSLALHEAMDLAPETESSSVKGARA